MSMCEKCWADAFGRAMSDTSRDQGEHYKELLEERKDNPCTLEEQSGEAFESAPPGEEGTP